MTLPTHQLSQHQRLTTITAAPRQRSATQSPTQLRVRPTIQPAPLDPIQHIAHTFDYTEGVRQ